MKYNHIAVLLIVLIAASGGCRTGNAVPPYTGFTRTDASGNIISSNPNDWKNTSEITGALAYPNPASGGTVMLRFNLVSSAYVTIKFYRDDSTPVITLAPGTFPAGSNEMLIDLSKLQTGWIYKCYIDAGSSQTSGNVDLQ